MEEENKKVKSRNFLILLYADSLDYDFESVKEIILTNYECLYILHFPEVEGKKEHYHFIVRTKSPRYISGVSKELGIGEKWIQLPKADKKGKRTLDSSLLYLIHKNAPEKRQYSLDDVKGNSSDLLEKLKSLLISYDLSDEDVLKNISDFIYNYTNEFLRSPNFSEILDFCCKEGFLAVYKKYYYIVRDLKYEVDSKFFKKF